MTNGIVMLIIGFGIMLVIAGLAVAVYGVVYSLVANRRVKEVNKTGVVKKAPPSPLMMFLILICTVVFGFLVLSITAVAGFYSVTNFSGNNDGEEIGFTTYAALNEAGEDDLLSDADPEQEIKGYTRNERTDGDYRFVYYTNNSGTDDPFPELIVYAEYTGAKSKALFYKTEFEIADDEYKDEFYNENYREGFLLDRSSVWFASDTYCFDGTLKLSVSATDNVTEADPDDFISTGVLEIDYGEFEE